MEFDERLAQVRSMKGDKGWYRIRPINYNNVFVALVVCVMLTFLCDERPPNVEAMKISSLFCVQGFILGQWALTREGQFLVASPCGLIDSCFFVTFRWTVNTLTTRICTPIWFHYNSFVKASRTSSRIPSHERLSYLILL